MIYFAIIFVVCLFFIFIIKLYGMNATDTQIIKNDNWFHYTKKYPVVLLLSSYNFSEPRLYEEITDDIGNQLLLVISDYRIGGKSRIILEAFSQVASDNETIIESHKLIRMYDEFSPDIYDDYYKVKDSININGIKEFLNNP